MAIKSGYTLTDEAVLRFRTWLLENHLTVSKFAKKCGCSRQYLEQILAGKYKITETVRDWFAKGGYEYL